MKKTLIIAPALFVIMALAACGADDSVPVPEVTQDTNVCNYEAMQTSSDNDPVDTDTEETYTEDNLPEEYDPEDIYIEEAITEDEQPDVVAEETPPENLPAEELTLQIDVATDELLRRLGGIHQVDLGAPEYGEGVTLVIWANKPLSNFGVVALSPDFLEDRDEWGFELVEKFGYTERLLPSEAFVVENYMGLGTLPHRGVSFTDEHGDMRVFFFIENQAYPEGDGGRWIIREIDSDQLI